MRKIKKKPMAHSCIDFSYAGEVTCLQSPEANKKTFVTDCFSGLVRLFKDQANWLQKLHFVEAKTSCHPELGCLLFPKACFREKWPFGKTKKLKQIVPISNREQGSIQPRQNTIILGNKIPYNSKAAFSLAEAMITLLMVSIIMAVMAPIISKKMKLTQTGHSSVPNITRKVMEYTDPLLNGQAEHEFIATASDYLITLVGGGGAGGGATFGSQEFTTTGTYTWNVPEGVTSLRVFMVGGGGSGAGGQKYSDWVAFTSNGGIINGKTSTLCGSGNCIWNVSAYLQNCPTCLKVSACGGGGGGGGGSRWLPSYPDNWSYWGAGGGSGGWISQQVTVPTDTAQITVVTGGWTGTLSASTDTRYGGAGVEGGGGGGSPGYDGSRDGYSCGGGGGSAYYGGGGGSQSYQWSCDLGLPATAFSVGGSTSRGGGAGGGGGAIAGSGGGGGGSSYGVIIGGNKYIASGGGGGGGGSFNACNHPGGGGGGGGGPSGGRGGNGNCGNGSSGAAGAGGNGGSGTSGGARPSGAPVNYCAGGGGGYSTGANGEPGMVLLDYQYSATGGGGGGAGQIYMNTIPIPNGVKTVSFKVASIKTANSSGNGNMGDTTTITVGGTTYTASGGLGGFWGGDSSNAGKGGAKQANSIIDNWLGLTTSQLNSITAGGNGYAISDATPSVGGIGGRTILKTGQLNPILTEANINTNGSSPAITSYGAGGGGGGGYNNSTPTIGGNGAGGYIYIEFGEGTGGGGGSGGIIDKTAIQLIAGQTYQVQVGTAGLAVLGSAISGGTGTLGNDGGNGGQSNIRLRGGSFVLGTEGLGGNGGRAGRTVVGTGGIAVKSGNAGQTGLINVGGIGGSTNDYTIGRFPNVRTQQGSGGCGGLANTTINGILCAVSTVNAQTLLPANLPYGAGGGGGGYQNGTAGNGASGFSGYVRLEWE